MFICMYVYICTNMCSPVHASSRADQFASAAVVERASWMLTAHTNRTSVRSRCST